MDLKQYYAKVADARAEIPEPWVFVTSLEDSGRGWKGDSVAEVSRETAAKLIVDKSHRIASPEEIKAYKDAAEKRFTDAQKARAIQLAPFVQAGRLLEAEVNAKLDPPKIDPGKADPKVKADATK